MTEDVDDFDVTDLKAYGIAAVNPDLFLASCSSAAGYLDALEFIAALSRNPRLTPEELHVRLGRAHPHTVQAHRWHSPASRCALPTDRQRCCIEATAA